MINKYNDITPKTLDEKKKYYAEHNIFKTNLWNKKSNAVIVAKCLISTTLKSYVKSLTILKKNMNILYANIIQNVMVL